MWVARDKNYVLHLFVSVKPIREGNIWKSVTNTSIEINERYFPNLNWKDEPIEVDILERGSYCLYEHGGMFACDNNGNPIYIE